MSYRCEVAGCRGNAPCASCRVLLMTIILEGIDDVLHAPGLQDSKVRRAILDFRFELARGIGAKVKEHCANVVKAGSPEETAKELSKRVSKKLAKKGKRK